ncbi:hypothetical protein BDV96DRAFT_598627 [Lophiotrema nucula]|uniref:Uncharacterized protein n=1 Tax=Lophiotrema nucula TaxID=690887 RepID=A0A6A5ZC37_9PLEO|nr:hypothetical protein BDV96DRAFT_598627 [Lophiotrema nucula]
MPREYQGRQRLSAQRSKLFRGRCSDDSQPNSTSSSWRNAPRASNTLDREVRRSLPRVQPYEPASVQHSSQKGNETTSYLPCIEKSPSIRPNGMAPPFSPRKPCRVVSSLRKDEGAAVYPKGFKLSASLSGMLAAVARLQRVAESLDELVFRHPRGGLLCLKNVATFGRLLNCYSTRSSCDNVAQQPGLSKAVEEVMQRRQLGLLILASTRFRIRTCICICMRHGFAEDVCHVIGYDDSNLRCQTAKFKLTEHAVCVHWRDRDENIQAFGKQGRQLIEEHMHGASPTYTWALIPLLHISFIWHSAQLSKPGPRLLRYFSG